MKLSLHKLVLGSAATLTIATIIACATDDAQPPEAPQPVEGGVIPGPDAAGHEGGSASDGGSGDAAPVDCTTLAFCVATAPISSFIALNAIWGSSATDVWIVGTRGTVLHGNGSTFTAEPWSMGVAADAGIASDAIFFSVWGSSKDDVWIGPPGAPLHYSVGDAGTPTWQVVEGAVWNDFAANQGRTSALWGSSKDNVWQAGPTSSRFNGFGSFWSKGVDGRSGVVWNAIDAFEGEDQAGPTIHALWGADANDIWAVGADGKAFRYAPPVGKVTPARWNALNTFTTVPLDSVWGSSATDVWAVGADGTLRHTNGDDALGFAVAASPTSRALHGIYGTGTSDIWAVGDHATVIHYDGKAWTVIATGLPADQTPDLFAVWSSTPDDVWIGGEGILLHRTTKNRRPL